MVIISRNPLGVGPETECSTQNGNSVSTLRIRLTQDSKPAQNTHRTQSVLTYWDQIFRVFFRLLF